MLLIFCVFILFVGTMYVLLTGIGLMKGRQRARTPALIFAAIAVFRFPLGTLLAIYSWWFLHNDGGKRLFQQQAP